MEKSKTFISKIILLTRHGQRIDNSPYRNKQKFPTDDPELTQVGREQSVKMGILIKNYIFEKFGISLNELNTQIVSSPFSRTLQTSQCLLKGYDFKSSYKIKIDNQLSECIYQWVVGNIPIKYLTVYLKAFNSKFDNKFEELENCKLETLDKLNLENLPCKYESQNDVLSRVEKSFSENAKFFFEQENDRKIEILQFISHAGTLALLRNQICSCINKNISKKNNNDYKDDIFNFSNNKISNKQFGFGSNNLLLNQQKIKPELMNVSTDYYDYCDTDVFLIRNYSDGKQDFEFLQKLSVLKKY